MGARLSCSCSQAECWSNDESTLRIDAEVFNLSEDGQKWERVDGRLAKIRVFNQFDESQPRIIATSSSGQVLLDTFVPIGEKVHKVSDFFVYLRLEPGGKTIGFNTLSARDTALFISQSSNTTLFNMFQHSFTASVSRIATFEDDTIQPCDEKPELTNVSLNPLSMVFNYKQSPVTIDLLECFACAGDGEQAGKTAENCVDITHANNIFRITISAHAHIFLIQALNVSSLLLARTTSPQMAISYLQRQSEKIQQKLIALLDCSESSTTPSPKEDVREMLLLKNVVVVQRLNALQQRPLPGIELIENDISTTVGEQLLQKCRLASLFLFHFNMSSFRIWRKPMEVRDFNSLPSTSSTSTSPEDHITTFNGTTTFHTTSPIRPDYPPKPINGGFSLAEASENRMKEISEQKRELNGNGQDYRVRKTNGRLGLTIFAHNDEGTVRAEVRGVTSFAPRSAQVGDSVVAVDGELISTLRNPSDVEKLLRVGKTIHLRRNTPLAPVPKAPTQMDPARKATSKLVMTLQELLTTEKKYVADLREMNDVFLSIRTVREIMVSALKLYKIQIAFVDSIEEAVGDISRTDISVAQIKDSVMRVSAVIVNKSSEFKIYSDYSTAYQKLQAEIKHNKDLLTKLEAVNRTKEQHCSWESKMIKPIQRIVQYPLLLKSIIEALQTDGRERIQAEAALQKMKSMADFVNEMQRINEKHSNNLETVRKAYENVILEKGIRFDLRELSMYGCIKWKDAPAEYFDIFLFSTVILLLPTYVRRELNMKWVRVLPINEIDIDELSSDPVKLKLRHAAFEGPNGQLSHSYPNTIYNVECTQPEFKPRLIRGIKKARHNFSRECRPLSGSSLSDGGYASEVSKDHRFSK